MESRFRISVIGLGIIGGSAAYALKGFKQAVITGYDRSAEILKAALEAGAIDRCAKSSSDAILGADLVIIATYPEGIIKIVKDGKSAFKKGAVICDFCGVKHRLSEEIKRILPKGVDYVGGHPMAGKEVDGFINAEKDLYRGSGFIITPVESSKKESIKLVYEMAEYLGAERISVNTPKKHDEIIAYTSDLMHIASSGICLDYNPDMDLSYTAGAFRDCTRIALINPKLWTELFLENADNTVFEIDRYINSLLKFRQAIAERNEKELFNLLKTVHDNKVKILNMEPKEDIT